MAQRQEGPGVWLEGGPITNQWREAVRAWITWTDDTGTPLDSPPTTQVTDPSTATPASATGSGSCATCDTLAVASLKDQMLGTVAVG